MVMHWLRRLQPIFLLLALLFVTLLLRSQWTDLRAYDWQIHAGWLLASALLMLASWLMEIGIWRHLLALVGGALPFAAAVRIWFLSAIMRYIPGNVWQPLSMTVFCRRWSIRPEVTVTSVALYQAVLLLAAAPMALLYAGVTGTQGAFFSRPAGAIVWLAMGALLPGLIFIARPQWLIQLMNWALARMGREVLPVRLSTPGLLALLLIAALNWLLWGASFAALAFGLGDYNTGDLMRLAPPLILAYPIAYAIGFLSFITPSGFGAREGAFVLLLTPGMDAGVVTVIALAMRVWTTAGELLMAGGAFLWARAVRAPELEGEPMREAAYER